MTFGQIADASGIVGRLRLFKSPAEVKKAERAAQLSDDALDAALPLIRQGGDEAAILAAMQGAIFAGGGDYPANEFIIGSGPDALLCRYKAGRRKLAKNDQLTLEWSGVFHHYHAPMMRTVLTGKASKRHQELFEACKAALTAIERTMAPGSTFGDVFDAHARTMEQHGLTKHRLNACGYSVGARFTPSWMDMPMFYQGNPEPIAPNMTLFAHMIIFDSEAETAMTLGRTYLTTESAPKPLSRHDLDLIVQ
jgi:Xaa-Pro dipeptidase